MAKHAEVEHADVYCEILDDDGHPVVSTSSLCVYAADEGGPPQDVPEWIPATPGQIERDEQARRRVEHHAPALEVDLGDHLRHERHVRPPPVGLLDLQQVLGAVLHPGHPPGRRVDGDLFIDCSGLAARLIGQHFGVTRERIRQIESKTMSKLRHPSRSQVLRDYLD